MLALGIIAQVLRQSLIGGVCGLLMVYRSSLCTVDV